MQDTILAKSIVKELLPYIVGLRNDLKGAIKTSEAFDKFLARLNLSESAEIKSIELHQKEISVDNFPQLIKTEVTNFPTTPSEIEVKGFSELVNELSERDQIFAKVAEWAAGFKVDLPDVFKVKVENQIEFPKEIKISNFPEQQKAPTKISIKNSEPSQAIPVRLVTKDGKGFYEALQQILSFGSEINLSGIKDLLDDIKTNTAALGGTPTTIASGSKTVATPGTQVQLVAIATECKRLLITPLPSNQGMVYWGGSDVSAVGGSEVGVPIAGLGAIAEIEIDDVSKIWIDAVTAGDGVMYNYFN